VKLCYALRRGVYFPSARDVFGEMPPKELRPRYLKAVKEAGFAGVEIPATTALGATEAAAKELRQELEEAGLPAVCVRAGGPVANPRAGAATMAKLLDAIRFASWMGAGVVNGVYGTLPTYPGGPGSRHVGEPVSQGSSRTATEYDFERTAERIREAARLAADLGITISIEVHQGSYADNSWSALHLLDLIGMPNVGLNPDLGNIYWQYEEPEETSEAAIVAMAPKAVYWHCKDLVKVHVPELHRSIYLRVPLGEGDIDYRFAIAAMVDAGYEGYCAVEGAREGDQLTKDARSAAYVRTILASLG
jgi:sugar phosphate isomerase/epimerase